MINVVIFSGSYNNVEREASDFYKNNPDVRPLHVTTNYTPGGSYMMSITYTDERLDNNDLQRL